MTGPNLLLDGLNALGRAHTLDYFVDGHRGAAIVAGFYLPRENEVEPGVAEAIAGSIDRNWARTPLCASFPEESPDPELRGRILECLVRHSDGLRQVGHNVIFSSLALKAFRDEPAALTPSRVEGICRMLESFTAMDIPPGPEPALPDFQRPAEAAEFILCEFVDCTERFLEKGQGWSGHLLTYGAAMLDLVDLDHAGLLEHLLGGFSIYIRRIRLGPLDGKEYREHPKIDVFPRQRAYWERPGGDLRLGHKIKYPYGFYNLMARARDAELKRRCRDVVYRLF